MEAGNAFSLELIKEYQKYFFEKGYSIYFVPETQIDLKAIEYQNGVILEFIFTINKDSRTFDYITGQPVSYLRITSIEQAFEILTIRITDFLSGEQNKELTEAIEQNKPYFTGTVVFFNVENNKIYLIKEKKEELWSKEAAEQDINRLIKEIQAFAS